MKPHHAWRTVLRGELRAALPVYAALLMPWALGLAAAWVTLDALTGVPRVVVLVLLGAGWMTGLVAVGSVRSASPPWRLHGLRIAVVFGTALGSGWLFLPTDVVPSDDSLDLAGLPFGVPTAGLAALLWWSLVRPRLLTWLLGLVVVPVVQIIMVVVIDAALAHTGLIRTLRAVDEDWWTSGTMLAAFILMVTTGCWFAACRWRHVGAAHPPGSAAERFLDMVEHDDRLDGLTGNPPAVLSVMWLAGAPWAFFMAVYDMQKASVISRHRRHLEH